VQCHPNPSIAYRCKDAESAESVFGLIGANQMEIKLIQFLAIYYNFSEQVTCLVEHFVLEDALLLGFPLSRIRRNITKYCALPKNVNWMPENICEGQTWTGWMLSAQYSSAQSFQVDARLDIKLVRFCFFGGIHQ
jgi:hypothetical protein